MCGVESNRAGSESELDIVYQLILKMIIIIFSRLIDYGISRQRINSEQQCEESISIFVVFTVCILTIAMIKVCLCHQLC